MCDHKSLRDASRALLQSSLGLVHNPPAPRPAAPPVPNTTKQILGQGAMASPMIALKGPLMDKKDYSPNFPLKHAQKDMRFALGLGDKVILTYIYINCC